MLPEIRGENHCKNHGSLPALQRGAAGTRTRQVDFLPPLQRVLRHFRLDARRRAARARTPAAQDQALDASGGKCA